SAVERAEDAVEAEMDHLIPPGANRDPRVQAKAAAAITDLLRPIPDPVLRFSYGRVAAGRLGIPVELLARRMGGGAAPPEPVRPEASGAGLVRSLEEQVLDHLLREDETSQIPPLEAIPLPEVFFDTGCRNIYQAFCTLYAEAGAPPDFQMLRSRLGGDEGSVARLAKIVLERGVASGRIGLSE